MGNQKYGIDSDVLSSYAKEIKSIVDKECQIAIVIGGGNIYRGIQSEKSGFIEFKETIWECLQQ